MPRLPDALRKRFSFELACPNCEQRHLYTPKELVPHPVPGNMSEGPLYRKDMRWERVRGCGLDFFVFASENDPIEPAMRLATKALGLIQPSI